MKLIAYIYIENRSSSKTVSVYAGDVLIAKDLTGLSSLMEIPSGSIIVTVFDNRERKMLDVYLPFYPARIYLLEILTSGYRFRPIGFF